MNWKIALVLFAGILMITSPVLAQQTTTGTDTSQPTTKKAPRLDIIPLGGYVWTLSRSATYNLNSGDIDLKSGGYYGIAFDIHAIPVMQFRLLYRRQDTQLTFKRGGGIEETLGDVAVEYWHVGVVKGMKKGKLLPFTTFSLGGTRFATDVEDSWKFSVLIGLGAKVYLNDRLGIMVAGQMPISFTDAFVGVGTGGVSLGGTGITQFDVTGGLIITL